MALTKIGNNAIPSSAVTQHVTETDLQPVKSDISALALREATNESSAAFNLPNQFIDTFTDDTNLGTQTDVDRTSGYIGTNLTISGIAALTSGSGTWSVPTGVTSAEILIVGGGASGGRSPNVPAGGGGAGGIVYKASHSFTNTDISSGIAYSIGAGGTGVGMNSVTDGVHGATEGVGNNGGDTTFALSDGTITAKGGGTGGGYDASQYRAARSGGSGGGGAWNDLNGGSSNQASFTGWTKYGNAGGTIGSHSDRSAGGGGAGGVGGNATGSAGGNGGVGVEFSNFSSYGASGWFGGGGAGSHDTGSAGTGGQGGGGGGATATNTSGGNATANTGGGGGAPKSHGYNNFTYRGGNGGSGFIGIKYSTTGSATGTLIQSANAVGSAKTKVGGTMLYKDNAGTATLGTDLKIYFTCNGGTNWTEASSYSAITPVYSTGVKQVRLGETTCTSGTDVRYKAVWANQSAGSKETQLHGIGVNY